jgi:hypothetical protein
MALKNECGLKTATSAESVGEVAPQSGVRGRGPTLPRLAAAVLALESLVFVGVHAKYHEVGSIVMVVVLGLLMAFIAYGRMMQSPII